MTTKPGLEGLTVSQWLWGRLTSDAALRALAGGQAALEGRVTDGTYAGSAPWWIEFTILEPQDVKVVGLLQVMARVRFQAKVVGPATSYGPLMEPFRLMHGLLESQVNQTTATLGQVLTCERVSAIQYPEVTDGIQYRHLGGLYETLTQ